MLLTIDVGNSNTKFGVYEGETLCFVSRMATDPSRLEDQYATEMRALMGLYNIDRARIDSAIIGSVVPSITESLRKAIEKLFRVDALIVKYDTALDLEIAIQNPRETGADLILACVAAKEKYACPCIIIDMGTATKLIVMDNGGRMLGGCIIPGLGVSLNALYKQAALLTAVSMETPGQVIGNSTEACIQSGAVYGSAAMLDELCDRMEAELGASCQIIATGGLAAAIVKNCRREITFDETLVQDGLRIAYRKSLKR